jgi:hypothetical protein
MADERVNLRAVSAFFSLQSKIAAERRMANPRIAAASRDARRVVSMNCASLA